jgi:hypothetical protein
MKLMKLCFSIVKARVNKTKLAFDHINGNRLYKAWGVVPSGLAPTTKDMLAPWVAASFVLFMLNLCSFFSSSVSSLLRALFSSDLWGSCDESTERRVLRHLLTLHFGLILADFWPQLLNEDVLFELR